MQQIMDKRRDNLSSEESPPLLAALGKLPGQHLRVILRPSLQTLRQEVRWAHWGTVIVQFLALVVITVTLNLLGHALPNAALHTIAASSIDSIRIFGWLPAPFNGIVFILATFLIGLGTAYPFSRMSRKRAERQGRLVEHTFVLLLVTIPLVTISGALLLIPATGASVTILALVVGALFLYRMVLHALTIRVVHGLPALEATLIVLIIPMLILLLLLIVGIFVGLANFADGAFLDGFDLPDISWDKKKKDRSR